MYRNILIVLINKFYKYAKVMNRITSYNNHTFSKYIILRYAVLINKAKIYKYLMVMKRITYYNS